MCKEIPFFEEYSCSNNLSTVDFQVFPNPTNGIFQIISNSSESFDFKITNSKGDLITQKNKNQRKEKVDLSYLSSGVYFITINDSNKTTSLKLIKID